MSSDRRDNNGDHSAFRGWCRVGDLRSFHDFGDGAIRRKRVGSVDIGYGIRVMLEETTFRIFLLLSLLGRHERHGDSRGRKDLRLNGGVEGCHILIDVDICVVQLVEEKDFRRRDGWKVGTRDRCRNTTATLFSWKI